MISGSRGTGRPVRRLPLQGLKTTAALGPLIFAAVMVSANEAAAQNFPCQINVASTGDGQQTAAVGRVVAAIGDVRLETGGTSLSPHQVLCDGQVIIVGQESRATIYLEESRTWLKLGAGTRVTLQAPTEKGASVQLLEGLLYFFSRVRQSLDIETPYANAGITGTEVLVEVDRNDRAFGLTVYEGDVVIDDGTSPDIAAGERFIIAQGDQAGTRSKADDGSDPFQTLLIDAPDRMAWTLFYPVLFTEAKSDPVLRDASILLGAGRALQAEALLDGRADADALAVRAIIALAQAQRDLARDLAGQAYSASPDANAPVLAQSFVLQSDGEIDAALTLLRDASLTYQDDAVILARLAELSLAAGDRAEARQAAGKATDLAPSAVAFSVLGFAALTEFDTRAARHAFAYAIKIDPEFPLARLGMGLTQIRDGAVAQGREAMELAVTLDPLSSIFRSYLAKAYGLERNDARARTQLDMAATIDPEDPTPWYYGSLIATRDARYLDALTDLEKSTALNDNRAVTRSSLLLDADRAARGSDKGRIYRALGFEKSAVNEAVDALAADPTNASGHRLLADIYANRPRHEIARASELFQSQLMGTVGTAPLQPTITQTDVNVLGSGSPFAPGLNEYSSLFAQNGVQGSVSGMVGGRSLIGEEILLTGRSDGFQLAVGQSYIKTDGFRRNNNSDNNLKNVFMRYQPTADMMLLAELRHRKSNRGDIELKFDLDDKNPNEDREIDERSLRLGMNAATTQNSQLMLSATILDEDRDIEDQDVAGPITFNESRTLEEEGYQLEGRFDAQMEDVSFTFGGSYYSADEHEDNNGTVFIPGPGLIPSPRAGNTYTDIEQKALYAQASLTLLDSVILDGGFGIESFEDDEIDIREPVGRAGVTWMPHHAVTVRAAAIRSLARPQALNQTLEPTSVAGFNRFFDDQEGSKIDTYGAGIDFDLAPGLKAGVDGYYRDLRIPRNENPGAGFNVDYADHEELTGQAYVAYAPNNLLSMSLALVGDRFEKSEDVNPDNPDSLTTITVPARLGINHPSGFFADIAGHWVYQNMNSPDDGGAPRDGDDNFFILNLRGGYRVDDRAFVAITVRNALDQNFDFRDDNFRQTTARRSPYEPGATLMVSGSIHF